MKMVMNGVVVCLAVNKTISRSLSFCGGKFGVPLCELSRKHVSINSRLVKRAQDKTQEAEKGKLVSSFLILEKLTHEPLRPGLRICTMGARGIHSSLVFFQKPTTCLSVVSTHDA